MSPPFLLFLLCLIHLHLASFAECSNLAILNSRRTPMTFMAAAFSESAPHHAFRTIRTLDSGNMTTVLGCMLPDLLILAFDPHPLFIVVHLQSLPEHPGHRLVRFVDAAFYPGLHYVLWRSVSGPVWPTMAELSDKANSHALKLLRDWDKFPISDENGRPKDENSLKNHFATNDLYTKYRKIVLDVQMEILFRNPTQLQNEIAIRNNLEDTMQFVNAQGTPLTLIFASTKQPKRHVFTVDSTKRIMSIERSMDCVAVIMLLEPKPLFIVAYDLRLRYVHTETTFIFESAGFKIPNGHHHHTEPIKWESVGPLWPSPAALREERSPVVELLLKWNKLPFYGETQEDKNVIEKLGKNKGSNFYVKYEQIVWEAMMSLANDE